MRFPNPHMNPTMQAAMMQQQQQQFNPTQPMMAMQPMQPQMQMQPQMPMQQQQMVMVMTPNGPVMMPVMSNQQPQMPMQQPMQQGGGFTQQFGMPAGNNQSVVTSGGRFSQGGAVQQQFQPQVNDDAGRFNAPQQFQYQEPEPEQVSTKPTPFTVKPTAHKFDSNERISLHTITNPIKSTDVKTIQGTISVDCFQEVVESIVEDTYKEEHTKPVTIRNFIIANTFYHANINSLVKELVEGLDIKALYKQFKQTYRELNDKYQLNAFNQFNVILTDLVNDYIAVNSENSVSIDSFMADFNDLLKVIRNMEEDLEDNLIEYMNSNLQEMRNNLESLQLTDEVGIIPEDFNIAYLDRIVEETGLQDLEVGKFVNIESNAANAYLISIFNEVTSSVGGCEFILVTVDKSIFKCMMSEVSDYYIKKIS